MNADPTEGPIPRDSSWIEVLDRLANDLSGEGEPLSALARARAEAFLRELPAELPMPELGLDPDGDVALDWSVAHDRRLSLSLGDTPRAACAWIDGASSGHCVEIYDGRGIPRGVLERLRALCGSGAAAC
jgi:hypothetical protein